MKLARGSNLEDLETIQTIDGETPERGRAGPFPAAAASPAELAARRLRR